MRKMTWPAACLFELKPIKRLSNRNGTCETDPRSTAQAGALCTARLLALPLAHRQAAAPLRDSTLQLRLAPSSIPAALRGLLEAPLFLATAPPRASLATAPGHQPHPCRTVGAENSGGEVAARAQQLPADGLADGALVFCQQRHQVACQVPRKQAGAGKVVRKVPQQQHWQVARRERGRPVLCRPLMSQQRLCATRQPPRGLCGFWKGGDSPGAAGVADTAGRARQRGSQRQASPPCWS